MEQPNLSFIKEITGDDIAFQQSILEIIKKEIPEEVEAYTNHFNAQDFEEASKDVHKIKHKVSLLGLKKGLELSDEHEKNLQKSNPELHISFIEIIDKINVYLTK